MATTESRAWHGRPARVVTVLGSAGPVRLGAVKHELGQRRADAGRDDSARGDEGTTMGNAWALRACGELLHQGTAKGDGRGASYGGASCCTGLQDMRAKAKRS
ncbi:hypothetical protein ZWY2020_001286 [Hordeum vulgare]|nr:hypothetical protein ZWY2020_001286 [Hordeum vulgare]